MTIASRKTIIVTESDNLAEALVDALDEVPVGARLVDVTFEPVERRQLPDRAVIKYGTVRMTFELEQAS